MRSSVPYHGQYLLISYADGLLKGDLGVIYGNIYHQTKEPIDMIRWHWPIGVNESLSKFTKTFLAIYVRQ